MKNLLAVVGVLLLIGVVLIATGLVKNPFANTARIGKNGVARTANGSVAVNGNDEITCEYQDANGNVITIKGKGPEMEKMCKAHNGSEPKYFTGYSYPYYPYRWYYSYYPYSYYYYPYYGYNWNYYSYYPYYTGSSIII